MKEMRLFEVGFKDGPSTTSYEYKFNVAADDSGEAEEMARAWIMENHIEWWEETGREDEIEYRKREKRDTSVPAMSFVLDEELDRLRGLRLAKLYDVGTLIV